MTYFSPLHILDGKDISQLDAGSLKKLRREFLLQFDLQQQTTIRINDKEYDKANILSLFDKLKTDGEFHLRIYQNKDLLNFLEKGNIRFFSNKKSWVDWNDPAFRQWVSPYFIEKMSTVIFQFANKKGYKPLNQIKRMMLSDFQLEGSLRDQTFSRTFNFLNNFVKKANAEALSPFIPNSDSQLKREMEEFLHPHYLKLLKALPKRVFQPIIQQYGKFARKVLSKAFYRDRKFREFKARDLRLLVYATDIHLLANPYDYEIQKLGRAMRSAIHPFGTLSTNDWSFFTVIRVLAFSFLLFIAFLSMCKSINSRKEHAKKYVPLNLKAMVGEWENTFLTGQDSIPVKRILAFSDKKLGVMHWYILDKSGNEKCAFSRDFQYTIVNFGDILKSTINEDGNSIQFKYDHRKEMTRNCEVLNNTEAKIASSIENILNVKSGYWFEPVKFQVDASGRVKPTFPLSQKLFLVNEVKDDE